MADPPILRFHKLYAPAISPMPGDKSALGALPASAFQYCEAVRTASGWGHYIFPPMDLTFLFDGRETFIAQDGRWLPLVAEVFDEEFQSAWNRAAPPDLADSWPACVTALPIPGVVQIWTGYLVSSAPGWATHVRPMPNSDLNSSYSCYEGIVETDDFRPCPLFMNIRLIATDREINLQANKPFFTVQPVPKAAYGRDAQQAEVIDCFTGNQGGLSAEDWDGLRRTMRRSDPRESDRPVGSYGAAVRKAAR